MAGKKIIAVVHDRYFIERFATEIWRVQSGGLQRQFEL